MTKEQIELIRSKLDKLYDLTKNIKTDAVDMDIIVDSFTLLDDGDIKKSDLLKLNELYSKYTEEKLVDTWEMYYDNFTDGEEIIAIGIDDKMYWGTLTTFDTGIRLTRFRRVSYLKFEDIWFMCKEGFPLSSLKGADSSPAIDKIDNLEILKELRAPKDKNMEEFPKEPLEAKGRYRKDENYIGTYIRMGGPFDIKFDNIFVANPGNYGYEYFGGIFEETVLLKHKDSTAIMWDLPMTLHIMEGINDGSLTDIKPDTIPWWIN